MKREWGKEVTKELSLKAKRLKSEPTWEDDIKHQPNRPMFFASKAIAQILRQSTCCIDM